MWWMPSGFCSPMMCNCVLQLSIELCIEHLALRSSLFDSFLSLTIHVWAYMATILHPSHIESQSTIIHVDLLYHTNNDGAMIELPILKQ